MPVLGLPDVLENLLTTLYQSSGLSSWKISSLDKSATTVVLRFAGPQCQPDARATRFRRAYPPQLRRDGVRREAFVTRKAADNSSLPACPPPQSVQPPSCDSVTTKSQQDVTIISSQTTKSASYSTDQNVATQMSVYAKSYSPCDLFRPSPQLDPFDSVPTRPSARDARSVSSDSGDHNRVQESDACHTEACAFVDTDFGVSEAGMNSDTMHMTDIEVKAKQAGFKPE